MNLNQMEHPLESNPPSVPTAVGTHAPPTSVSLGPSASSYPAVKEDVSHGLGTSSPNLDPPPSTASEASYVIITPSDAELSIEGATGTYVVPGFNTKEVPDRIKFQELTHSGPTFLPNDNIESTTFGSPHTILPVVDNEQAPQTPLTQGILTGALPVASAASVPVVLEPIIAETAAAAGVAQGASSVAHSISETTKNVRDIIHDVVDRYPKSTTSTASSIPSSAGALHRARLESDEVLIPAKKAKRANTSQSSQGTSLVKIGDNSIVTDTITSTLCSSMNITAAPTAGDFMQVMLPKIPDLQANFQVVNHEYVVRSIVYSSEIGGRLGPGVHQDNTVFQSFPAPVPDANVINLTVRAAPARKLGTIDIALLGAYMQGGNISERFVVSALQPKLNMESMQAARFLSEYVTSALEYCDNYLMYAKLMYQAMVSDVISELGLTPAVAAFPPGEAPNFVNLDDPNLNYLDIAQPIVRGDIILVDRIDYCANDLQVVHWLTKSGHRATNDEDVTPHCIHVNWPAINVTVLNHGAAPAQPQAEILTPSQIYAFVIKLANARGEMSAVLRGMYFALDLLGVTYNSNAGIDNGRYHFRTSMMSFHSPNAVMPRDYNVLLRILHIRPISTPAAEVEVSTLTTTSRDNRVRLMSMYSSTLQAMSTTVLYDMNLTHELMVQWGNGDPALPPMAAMVLQKFSEPDRAAETEAPMFTRPKALFPTFIGCQVPTQLYPNSTWLGQQGQSQNAGAAMTDQLANRPPNNASPLSIDNWLLIRPMEWGISGPNTTLDIGKEVMDVGAPALRGWRSVRGSEVYDQRTTSPFPAMTVVYGIQVLNAILNDFRWHAARQLSFSQAAWSPGAGMEWNAPVIEPHWQGHYIEGLHVMQPCTVMSYDYTRDIIMAPALVGPIQLTNPELRRLYNWRGQPQSQVGFYQSTAPPHTGISTAMQALMLEGMFGGAPTPTSVAASQQPPPSN